MSAPTQVISIVALSFLLSSAIPAEAQTGGRLDAGSDAVSAASDNVFARAEPDIPQTQAVSFDFGTTLTRDPATVLAGGIERAARRDASWFRVTQASTPRQRGWAARHPVLLGALIGFGSGFLMGYLPGDDGVFDDFTAGFNGSVMEGLARVREPLSAQSSRRCRISAANSITVRSPFRS